MARIKGILWFIIALITSITAGFIAYITLINATTQKAACDTSALTEVVVASRTINTGRVLTQGDLTIEEMPVRLLPDGAFRYVANVIGMVALTDLYPGEIVLGQKLANPDIVSGNGRIAAVLAEDHVIMAIPTTDLMSNINLLKPGDQVDILYSLDTPRQNLAYILDAGGVSSLSAKETTKQTTFIALEDVTIAAVVSPYDTIAPATPAADQAAQEEIQAMVEEGASAILIAVMPQDALMLKYLQDAGGVFDVVLRSPTNDLPSDARPVDIDYIIHRFQLPTK
ncbi:MAG TPA: Flp pilus assembly protein CpaB [Anaerolineae bacterium]|nr:Flp pilus assembly protein CpaB [Anaerolineae bacterium]